MGSLLNDKLVGVDEIPVVPSAQPELVRADFAPGKDFLCQRPFCARLSEGRTLAAESEARNIKFAVQQQVRFDEGIAAALEIADLRWIGLVTPISFDV